jgi:DNA-binding NarL/FixJ family response regulator
MLCPADNLLELSTQQIDCLKRVANGQSYDSIAHELSLSEFTIKLLISDALQKLGAFSITHAVVIAIKSKLIDIK